MPVGLHKPFTHNGFTWATNGRIAVRVPSMESVPENGLAPKNTAYVFKPFDAEKCIAPMPVFPPVELVACSSCGGTGEEADGSACWKCEGEPMVLVSTRYGSYSSPPSEKPKRYDGKVASGRANAIAGAWTLPQSSPLHPSSPSFWDASSLIRGLRSGYCFAALPRPYFRFGGFK